MEHLDVLIVGAGISGIGAAVHLGARCPGLRLAILEARAELGGTWQLFRYPGVRSDSDMYTYAFSFRPWTAPCAIADGASILQYLKDTAREQGLNERLRFGHAVRHASWSSQTCRWTVTAERAAGGTVQLTCALLYMCTGYYDPAQGYRPELSGAERFLGQIVHPQHWPPELVYAGKRVVVIGSGATAVSLVPALARSAAHVTLVQRSPSYVLAAPARDPLVAALGNHRLGGGLARWCNILVSQLVFQLCRRAPQLARRAILQRARRALGESCDVDRHFSPRYEPWRQRLCIAPDGDLFQAIRSGRASVVTGTVEAFTPSGLALAGGTQLPAELVVTATGFELQLMSNLELVIDGARCDASRSLSYRGVMFSGVPNLVASFGYSNASWTLRSELTARYVCRLLQHMKRHGYRKCLPTLRGDAGPLQPFVDLSSSYVQRGVERFPRQGSRARWRVSQSYLLDWFRFRWARFSELEFSAAPSQALQSPGAPEGQPA